jgi:hypothetical protein
LYLIGPEDLSLGYQNKVGYPDISIPSTSLRVPSKSARTTFLLAESTSAAA